MYLPSVGHNSRKTAQRFYLHPRELLSCKESVGFDIDVGHRPAGSLTLSLQEHVFPSGLSSMSQFVSNLVFLITD